MAPLLFLNSFQEFKNAGQTRSYDFRLKELTKALVALAQERAGDFRGALSTIARAIEWSRVQESELVPQGGLTRTGSGSCIRGESRRIFTKRRS